MPELLSSEAVERELADLPEWARDGDTLTRTWTRKGFNGAMQVANVVAYVANRIDHHPDITVHGYKNVTVTTTTHDSGGLTAKDIELARAVEATLGQAG